MMKRVGVLALFALFFCHMFPGVSYADNAEVLPKGVSRVSLNGQFYFPVDERYDPDGHTEDIAADYNAALDSSVFPALAVFEGPPFNLPVASVGDSVVDFEFEWQELDFFYQLGVTDRLTVGIHIPYWWNKTDVKEARLDTTNATVGKNVAMNTLLPLAVPGTVPLTTEDIQNLLGAGLDINGDGIIDVPGFGYKRFETWSESGLADVEAGFRYQYFKTENWRLAFTGAVRFPTGKVDDPDNLIDSEFGEGVWAGLFQFQNDYIGIENLVLNATFRYELKFPDEEKLRIPDNVDQPITANMEKVDRDLGDVIEFEIEGSYDFLEGLSFSLLYEFEYYMQDEVSGNLGFNYESLEDETRRRSHIGIVTLCYSTIPRFQKKKFPVPLEAFVRYRNRFAGKNIPKSQWIGVGLSIFF